MDHAMNKAELIDVISIATDLPKVTAARALDAFTASITTALQRGNGVSLVGFGTFTVKARAAREGRNLKTGPRSKSLPPSCRASSQARA